MIRIGAELILREYQISSQSNSVASAAQLMVLPTINGLVRLILEAVGDRIVFNFGGSGVVASNTVASNKLTDGNFSVAAGFMAAIDINGQSQAYVSLMNVAQASGATGYIRVCAIPY